MWTVEALNQRALPLAKLIGIRFVSVSKDEIVAELVVREELCTANSTVHGGTLMAFADTVGATGTFVNLPEGAKGTTTIESKTNFLAGAGAGARLIATATPIHRGRRTQVWQTVVKSEDGKTVSLTTQTQMVL